MKRVCVKRVCVKRFLQSGLLLALTLCLLPLGGAALADEVIEPAWPVPDYVQWLLEVAAGEVGQAEDSRGVTKYGTWAGDPTAQWCAEYLDWCVDQVDQQHGTQLLEKVYPRYSGSNTGRAWFIREGRYITRNGNLADWGYQWMQGEEKYITTGTYIPQPGDWMFFTWTSDTNTDHVAMVEYCTRAADGSVTIHVLEGNNPDKVQRNTYAIDYKRILGYGTVRDVADWTMRSGCAGEKVRQLQEKLAKIGFLLEEQVDGLYGANTVNAVTAYQRFIGEKESGIANIATQLQLNRDYRQAVADDPATWQVVDDEDDNW